MKKRPITIASGQFGDMSLEELASICENIGYEGIELASHAHIDIDKAYESDEYIEELLACLQRHKLNVYAISTHLIGQCVGDVWDPRLDNFVPNSIAGKPAEIRKWAVESMMKCPLVAKKLGIDVVTGFMGSPIWAWWYSYPQTTKEMIEEGFQKIYELWTPIFDEFDKYGIKFALEVHPTEIAFDYYTTERLLRKFGNRKTLGINYDPSHLVWQGINELTFLHDFRDRVYHVHIKDVKINRNERAGILGSNLDFGDTRRAWNFVSVGHGNVDFDGIIRELNEFGYCGPLSVEWEDSGMDRLFGARESYNYIKEMNFSSSDIAFDAALANK